MSEKSKDSSLGPYLICNSWCCRVLGAAGWQCRLDSGATAVAGHWRAWYPDTFDGTFTSLCWLRVHQTSARGAKRKQPELGPCLNRIFPKRISQGKVKIFNLYVWEGNFCSKINGLMILLMEADDKICVSVCSSPKSPPNSPNNELSSDEDQLHSRYYINQVSF